MRQREVLAAWQPRIHEICGGRIMRSATLHVTLVFLGNVAQHRLEALKLVGQEAEGKSFDLSFDKAHYWGHNHIAYAATDIIPPQLLQLVHVLERLLNQHHFQFERREYKPHVTLLRNAKWNDVPLPEMNKVVWQVKNFALLQSVPNDEGAHYRVLAKFRLH